MKNLIKLQLLTAVLPMVVLSSVLAFALTGCGDVYVTADPKGKKDSKEEKDKTGPGDKVVDEKKEQSEEEDNVRKSGADGYAQHPVYKTWFYIALDHRDTWLDLSLCPEGFGGVTDKETDAGNFRAFDAIAEAYPKIAKNEYLFFKVDTNSHGQTPRDFLCLKAPNLSYTTCIFKDEGIPKGYTVCSENPEEDEQFAE